MNENAFSTHLDCAVDDFDLDITYTVTETDSAQAAQSTFPFTTGIICK